MLQKVGLLSPPNPEMLPNAYFTYERDDDAGRNFSSKFKQTFSVEVKIKFLGVWYVTRPLDQLSISSVCRDTVESVEVDSKPLPFPGSNNAIEVFRHALALDERRLEFTPILYAGRTLKDQRTNSNAIIEKNTDVREVFFAGSHHGKFWLSPLQLVCYLYVPFQMSGDLWRAAHVSVSPAFPFDG